MNERYLQRYQTVLIGLLLSAVVVTAQTDTGSIGGFVKDPTGGVIPKAKVTLTNEGTGAVQTLATDGAGYYIAPNLPPGNYMLSAEAAGFKRFASAHNRLAPNTALSLDADLEVGNTTEAVQVTATAAILQTDSAAEYGRASGGQIRVISYNPANAVQLNSGGNVILGTGNPYNGVVIPGYSSFPSAGGRIAAFTSNACDGASCQSLLSAPNMPQSYIRFAAS